MGLVRHKGNLKCIQHFDFETSEELIWKTGIDVI
jgi:hypothetical protein